MSILLSSLASESCSQPIAPSSLLLAAEGFAGILGPEQDGFLSTGKLKTENVLTEPKVELKKMKKCNTLPKDLHWRLWVVPCNHTTTKALLYPAEHLRNKPFESMKTAEASSAPKQNNSLLGVPKSRWLWIKVPGFLVNSECKPLKKTTMQAETVPQNGTFW